MTGAVAMPGVLHRYLTQAEQRRLLGVVANCSGFYALRDLWWLRLLLATGLRVQEFSRVTVGDARFALATGWLYIPAAHRKGREGAKRDHHVPVTQPVREALDALLAINPQIGGATPSEDDPLVWSRVGRPMSVRSYQARLQFWGAQAGLPGVSPHWLRHSRAMNIMRRSRSHDPRGVVQGALGHASISSTGIYTRITKEDLQRELEVVDGGRVKRADVRALYQARRGDQ
ncbi:MAG: tyrosine-type recombinase/integrase [Burkholderiales bacterium]|nr:tyrosine-type recombinase/integrase [Burkholderiales bacterium]